MRKTITFLAILAAVIACVLPASAGENTAALATLFHKAIANSEIQAKDASAFRLQAAVRVYGSNQKYLQGTVIEFWTPQGMLRRETLLQNYKQIEVSDGTSQWQQSSLGYVPYTVHELWSALQFARRLQWWLSPVAGAAGGGIVAPRLAQVKATRLAGVLPPKGGLVCVQASLSESYASEFCFERATGHLITETDPDGVRYEYLAYAPFGDKSFPRVLRVINDRGVELAELRIQQLTAVEKPASSLFLPIANVTPEGALSACRSILPAKVVKRVPPVFPPAAREEGLSGTVVFYSYVGTDGVPRGLWPVKSSSTWFTTAAFQAASQWRYQPAACVEAGGAKRAIATPVYLSIPFTLQQQ